MSTHHSTLEPAFTLFGDVPSGDDKVLFPEDDHGTAYGGWENRFAGFEGRFDEFADALGATADQASEGMAGGGAHGVRDRVA